MCSWWRLWLRGWRCTPLLCRRSLPLRRGLILHCRTPVQSGHLGVVANEIGLLLLAHDARPLLDNRVKSGRSQPRFGLPLLKCLFGEQLPPQKLFLREQLLLLKVNKGLLLRLKSLLLRSQVIALDIVVLGLRDETLVEGRLDLLQIAQGRHRVRSRALLLVAGPRHSRPVPSLFVGRFLSTRAKLKAELKAEQGEERSLWLREKSVEERERDRECAR